MPRTSRFPSSGIEGTSEHTLSHGYASAGLIAADLDFIPAARKYLRGWFAKYEDFGSAKVRSSSGVRSRALAQACRSFV